MQRMLLLALPLALGACQTATRGSEQTMLINSDPPGAACTVRLGGQEIAEVAATPQQISFRRMRGGMQVLCRLDGYRPNTAMLAETRRGDIVAPGLAYLVSDAIDENSGANLYFPPDITVTLTREGEAPPPPSLQGIRLR